MLVAATGSWHAVFYVAAMMNLMAAFLALFVLKPMRARMANLQADTAPYSLKEKAVVS
jgi:OFA family oxalate/formate antiporter-like MFS transporter